jgi:hypothetical protein
MTRLSGAHRNRDVRRHPMPRAAFTYKSKAELEQLAVPEINRYIRTLRLRAQVLNDPARKSTEKQIAVATKLRDSLE